MKEKELSDAINFKFKASPIPFICLKNNPKSKSPAKNKNYLVVFEPNLHDKYYQEKRPQSNLKLEQPKKFKAVSIPAFYSNLKVF